MKSSPRISDLLQSLRSFALTARHGSQTEAARELGRTQPAVSQQLKHLEEELGVTLLQRQGSKLILTDIGESLMQLCTELFSTVDKIYGMAEAARIGLPVKIAVVFAVEYTWLPIFLRQMEEKFPHITVDLRMHLYRDVVYGVKNGSVDLGMTMKVDFPKNLRFEALYPTEHYLVCARDKKFNLHVPQKPDLNFLAGCKLLCTRKGTRLSDILEQIFAAHAMPFQPAKRVKYATIVRSLVLQGLGYAVQDGWDFMDADQLDAVSLAGFIPGREYGMLTLDGKLHSLAVQCALQVARNATAELMERDKNRVPRSPG